MSNIVYIATSIDGFIAKKDGSVDWLMEVPNPDGGDFGFSKFMENIDALVMGRNTFEMVLSFGEWPYTKKVFVPSNTLKSVSENIKDKAEIISGSPQEIVDNLNARNFKNLYIDGGKTVQEFLNSDLIDELIVTRIPILLGDGIPLFANLNKELRFEHVGTEIFNGAMVKSAYRRKR